MDWFCGFFKKKSDVIQVYKPIDSQNVSKAYPKSDKQITIARSTPSSAVQNIKKQTERIKPYKQFQLPTSQNGYINIKQIKKQQGKDNVLKKIVKSNYQQELQKCKSKKIKFTDTTFGHQLSQQIVSWKRITDIIKDATFMKYPIKPNQIIQGHINNCYWMSAVSSLSQRDYRIKNIFGSLQLSPYGIYMCKLVYNGIYQQIVVDDYFPVDAEGQLVYARPYQKTDFWVLVLQKCWAKLFGSYNKTNWGFNPQSLCALTGAPVKQYQTELFHKQSTFSKQLFCKLLQHDQKNHILTCAIQNKIDIARKMNLQIGHAYSMLGVFKTNYDEETLRLVLIRNPLGNVGVLTHNRTIYQNPNLPYHAKDPFWKKVSEEQKKRLQFWMIEKPGDGIFYVEWNFFLAAFDQIDVCSINDNSHYIYETIQMANGVSQYIDLQIEQPTQFQLIISQPNQRRLKLDKDVKYSSISVLVARVGHNFANELTYQYTYAKQYSPNIQTNYFPVNLGLKAGGWYRIRINVFNPIQQSTKITVGYYSPDDFAVKFIKNVDDIQFLNKTLLNRAKNQNSSSKISLNDAKGWYCIQNIIGSDLGYIAYHIQSSSQKQKYQIKIDQSKNQHGLYFLGYQFGKNVIEQTINRGQQVIFVYTYQFQLPDPDVFPIALDERNLPTPLFSSK